MSTNDTTGPDDFDAHLSDARAELDDIDRTVGIPIEDPHPVEDEAATALPATRAVPEQGAPAAGWYPDPQRPGSQRWWDGREWGLRAPEVSTPPSPQSFHGPAAYNGGNHTTVVVQQAGGGATGKNPGLAVLLAFLFGPLGMLYSTITGAVVMFLVDLILGVVTFGLIFFISWPIQMIWAYIAAKGADAGGGQVYASS